MMKFRQADKLDIDRINEIYEEIHTSEESGSATIGWVRGIYPSRQTARDAVDCGTMYVCEDNGIIVASAKLDQQQVPEYANAGWEYDVSDNQVMVMHTLVVSPSSAGHGYGSAFVNFYEKFARENNCTSLRIDTNEKNASARALYRKLGFKEVGIVGCDFNGIENIRLVCIEKYLY